MQVQNYIQAEIELGRIAASTDAASIAALLCGAAMQQAFLANFKGKDRVPGDKMMAAKLVAVLGLPSAQAKPHGQSFVLRDFSTGLARVDTAYEGTEMSAGAFRSVGSIWLNPC